MTSAEEYFDKDSVDEKLRQHFGSIPYVMTLYTRDGKPRNHVKYVDKTSGSDPVVLTLRHIEYEEVFADFKRGMAREGFDKLMHFFDKVSAGQEAFERWVVINKIDEDVNGTNQDLAMAVLELLSHRK